MAGRYDFMSGFADAQDPWFRIRNFDVTTTSGVVAVGLLSMVFRAFEGGSQPLTRWLQLVPGSVTGGQIWRIFTWPIVNSPGFFELITIAVFFMLGSQLESTMGRRGFATLLGVLTVIPAVVLVIVSTLLDRNPVVEGLDLVELGVLVAFCAQFHRVRFFNLIPAPILGAVIIGIQVLGYLGARNWGLLFMILSITGVALVGLRSLGHANDLEWIPKIGGGGSPRPARAPSSGGRGSRSGSAPSARGRAARPRRSRSRANLEAVPSPPVNPASASPENAADIDSLLDKIADTGMESLSSSERMRLEEHADRMRRQRGD